MLELPGLIDPHVHLREPGATHKEDVGSGTAAALAGGFTAILAMPNTNPPLTNNDALDVAISLASSKAACDYAMFLGAGEDNIQTAADLAQRVCGMKMYLDQTYGPLRLQQLGSIADHVLRWPKDKPIAAHSEGMSLAAILLLGAIHDKHVHICHVSLKEEILLIKAAKEKGYKVTCEVTPHHLFLTEDVLPYIGEGRAEVRPRLAAEKDREALWENLDVIDCFATDHAPHTLDEKDSENPPPGFPGLETALALLIGAVNDGRLTMDELIARMVSNPQRIFRIRNQEQTRVEFDPDVRWEVKGAELQSRSKWSPFEGLNLKGKVRRVTLRGRKVFEDGVILAPAGYGLSLF